MCLSHWLRKHQLLVTSKTTVYGIRVMITELVLIVMLVIVTLLVTVQLGIVSLTCFYYTGNPIHWRAVPLSTDPA